MLRGLVFVGLGAAAAVYFLDEKQGKKRRNHARKKFREVVDSAGEVIGQYSHQIGERAGEWSQDFPDKAREYAEGAKELASDLMMKNGSSSWVPSARLVGAIGSALAFYGAGRRGVSGALLRTLSLGLFTKALIASRP